MLHKVNSTYRELAKHFPELKNRLPSPVRKKQLLLEMAAKGEQKPTSKANLGQIFRTYTKTSSKMYDPEFTERIRELRPGWLATSDELINSKKRILLGRAAKGEAKPSLETSMGKFLYNCTLKSSIYFDPELTDEIKKLSPHWLTPSRPEKTSRLKQLLLEMAAKGEQRPSERIGSLYRAFLRYTRKSHGSYDPTFDKQIRKLAPHWFKQCSTR